MADTAQTLYKKGCDAWSKAQKNQPTEMHTAIGYIQRAVDLEPENSSMRATLARLFVQIENEGKAREQTQKALVLDPDGFNPNLAQYFLLVLHNKNLIKGNAFFAQLRVDWHLGKMDDAVRKMLKAFVAYCSRQNPDQETVLNWTEKLLTILSLQYKLDRSKYTIRDQYREFIEALKAFTARSPEPNQELLEYLVQAEGALATLS